MSIRELIVRRQVLSAGIAAGCIASAVAILIATLPGRPRPSTVPAQLWYSDDDGVTTFLASSDKIGPFDHNGKPAVTAHVFKMNGNSAVGYLERAVDAAEIYQINAARARLGQSVSSGSAEPDRQFIVNHLEVKRPGGGRWVRRSDPSAAAIATVTDPAAHGPADEVFP